MKDQKLLNLFKTKSALLEGHFLLSSGLHSNQYFQCALILQYPEIATELGKLLAEKFKEKVDAVVSPALGGLIIGQEVARAKECRAIFTERENGQMTLHRGFQINPGEKILVVEDVITTGGSTKEVIEVIKFFQGEVVGAGALVNRAESEVSLGIPLKTLLQLPVKSYISVNCPWCREKIPLVKPGSRTIKIGKH